MEDEVPTEQRYFDFWKLLYYYSPYIKRIQKQHFYLGWPRVCPTLYRPQRFTFVHWTRIVLQPARTRPIDHRDDGDVEDLPEIVAGLECQVEEYHHHDPLRDREANAEAF